MYRKPKIEDSLARNMFLGSNMDFCMADVTSEKVNEVYMERSSFEYSLARKKFSMSNMDFCQDDITSEDINLNHV